VGRFFHFQIAVCMNICMKECNEDDNNSNQIQISNSNHPFEMFWPLLISIVDYHRMDTKCLNNNLLKDDNCHLLFSIEISKLVMQPSYIIFRLIANTSHTLTLKRRFKVALFNFSYAFSSLKNIWKTSTKPHHKQKVENV
jgi:hypothetical protein